MVQIHGEVVGFLIGRAMADEAEILNLTVAPEHRRRGHATALVQEALGTFRTQGARRVLLEVRESNRGAVRFYESLGFRRAGRRPNYYPTPPEAAWCMVLELPSSIKR